MPPKISARGLILLGACALAAAFPSVAAGFSKAIWGPVSRDGVNQFPLYHELGVSIYETQLNWSQTAPAEPLDPTDPTDPAYRWPVALQRAIAGARAYRMRVLIQVIDSPAWANGGHRVRGWAPLQAGTFVAFVKAAARRYPSVRLWMIWGEPTKFGNFLPLAGAAPGKPLDRAQRAADRLYAEMVDGAYGVLKRLDRRNLVIGGCTYTTGTIDTQEWIENMRLPDGRAPRMDMYAHNPFSYTSPRFTHLRVPFGEVQFANLPLLAGWVDRYLHKGLPLFLSEWTIPTRIDRTFNFWVDPNLAAQWVTEALQESRGWRRIYALGWVNVYDDLPTTAGGLLTQKGTPKPDFYAFEHG
jgi:hypothetical protein